MSGEKEPKTESGAQGDGPSGRLSARRARQAEALRANLRRRKDQARRRSAAEERGERSGEES